MANSKANIYPIQLQGAQLNLNKFDAEIKQYNGFNKNNSPYVGGCLSPVFTKDEEHSGYTRDNTYIDINGDVYRIDTSGLWKNDVKKYSFSNSAKFVEFEKIEKGSSDFIVYHENLKIKVRGSSLYINDTDYVVGYYSGIEEPSDYKNTIDVVFSKSSLYNTEFAILACSGTITNLSVFIINLKNGEVRASYVTTNTSYKYTDVYIFTPTMDSSVGRYLPGGGGTVVILGNTENRTSNRNLCLSFNYTSYSLTLNFSINGINFIENENTPYYKYSGGWNFWHFGRNGEVYLKYPGTFSTTSNRVYFKLRVNSSSFSSSGISPTLVDYIDVPSSLSTTTLRTENLNIYNENMTKVYNIDFLSYVFQIKADNGTTYYKSCNCSGVVTFEKNSYGTLYVCSKVGTSISMNRYFSILMNNGEISGISTKDYGILLTDWNNLEINQIYFLMNGYSGNTNIDGYILILSKGNFYRIKLGDPKFKKIKNQIVMNNLVRNYDNSILEYFNCYFIDKEKMGVYAPGLNNAVDYSGSYSATTRTCSQSSVNNYFVSTAINEYDLEENASLLLNPLSVYKETSYSFVINSLNKNKHIYQGETEAVYNGLPFPSDSSGNVQYSPSLFSEIKNVYGNKAFIKNGNTFYPLMIGNNNEPVMSFYLASGIDNLELGFIIQGQFYGIINNGIYAIQYSNGVLTDISFIVDVTGLKFCGNTPYQAFFFSPTNRCLYSFSGANVLNQAQFIDKFEDVIGYKYNPATQTIFMITDTEVIAYSSFGIYEIFFENVTEVYILEKGVCILDNSGNFRYLQYYTDSGFTKENITLETCFYGTNDQTVNINDCLYIRLFDENHSAGDLVVSASTLKNEGRKTENTTFKIKSSDWDELTHSIYLRYQPKEQRGLGVSFSINSPFKIASMSVGSMPDSVLIDKVSKGAINAPYKTTSNKEW